MVSPTSGKGSTRSSEGGVIHPPPPKVYPPASRWPRVHLVVVCPRCKGATAVREDQKSATCPRCERSYDPRRSRAYHRSEDPAEVARLVGEMNARLEKGFSRYEADRRAAEPRRKGVEGDLESVVSRVSLVKGRQRQLEEAVAQLSSREEPSFSSGELFDVLEAVGWPRHAAEDALRRMLEEGVVVEKRPDAYGAV